MHDMPSRIDEFVIRTEGMLGDAEHIIHEHTLLPFYFPFRTQSEAANAVAAVRHGGIGALKGRLGILASRFGASHPLKACPQCMLDDQEDHQVAYWHMNHQWPGAWACIKHQQPLHYALFKVNGEGRFHWCLPIDVMHSPGIDSRSFEKSRDLVFRLTESAYGLAALPTGFHFSPTRLATTYQNRLHELGCYSPRGRLKSTELLHLLEVVCHPLSHVHGLSSLRGTDVSLLNQFVRLVGEHRGAAHPLRHFVIILALFNNWKVFKDAYDAPSTLLARNGYREDSDSPPTFDDSPVDPKKLALVEAVRNGQSVTAAAQLFDVAVATAMAWAAEAGIHTPKRAKLFTLSRRKNAIQMLKRGSSKEDVASTAGISVQTITLLLRTEPGLRSDWNQAKFDHIQKRSRASWSRMANKLNTVSGHFLRKLLPAEFAWLYRNDRSWLEDFNSALPRAEKSNNSNIHWDTRDAIFSQAIDAAALAIYLARPCCRIRLADLCNRIPELKARLSDLDQLPLTHAAIARATRSRAAD